MTAGQLAFYSALPPLTDLSATTPEEYLKCYGDGLSTVSNSDKKNMLLLKLEASAIKSAYKIALAKDAQDQEDGKSAWTYDQLVREILGKLNLGGGELKRAAFEACNQGTDPVNSYYLKWMNHLQDYRTVEPTYLASEISMMTKFKQGLRPDIRQQIKFITFTSLDDMVTKLSKATASDVTAASLSAMNASQSPPTQVSHHRITGHANRRPPLTTGDGYRDERLREAMFDLDPESLKGLREMASELEMPVLSVFKIADKKNGKCFYCNKTGHWARECPKKVEDYQYKSSKRDRPDRGDALKRRRVTKLKNKCLRRHEGSYDDHEFWDCPERCRRHPNSRHIRSQCPDQNGASRGRNFRPNNRTNNRPGRRTEKNHLTITVRTGGDNRGRRDRTRRRKQSRSRSRERQSDRVGHRRRPNNGDGGDLGDEKSPRS